jgi:hypothetical protein
MLPLCREDARNPRTRYGAVMHAQRAAPESEPSDSPRALWGLRLRVCRAVLALCLLAPGLAAAGESAHAATLGSASSTHGGLRFSWTPSKTEPYAVCGRPSVSHSQCLAVIVPASARSSSSSTLTPALAPSGPASSGPAPSSLASSSPASSSPSFSGGGVGGGFDPAELRSAYDLPSESAGAGQTVAIVDAYDDPNAESDLAVYRARYGIPSCTTANGCFRKVSQTGTTKYPTANASWAVEISLDLDMVSTACPNCHVMLVEASSNTDANLDTAEDEAVALGATEVSNSWAGPEFSGENAEDSYFDHPGIPITVAAGDEGYGVEYPAAARR